jgi:hypothetical protein
MSGPENRPVEAPALFDGFRERRTRGQRVRAAKGVVYTAIARVQRMWRRR